RYRKLAYEGALIDVDLGDRAGGDVRGEDSLAIARDAEHVRAAAVGRDVRHDRARGDVGKHDTLRRLRRHGDQARRAGDERRAMRPSKVAEVDGARDALRIEIDDGELVPRLLRAVDRNDAPTAVRRDRGLVR